MPEKICRRCNEPFKYDKTDIRKFIYHECSDGVMAAHDNPNNEKKSKNYIYKKTPTRPIRKSKTLWQNFK